MLVKPSLGHYRLHQGRQSAALGRDRGPPQKNDYRLGVANPSISGVLVASADGGADLPPHRLLFNDLSAGTLYEIENDAPVVLHYRHGFEERLARLRKLVDNLPPSRRRLAAQTRLSRGICGLNCRDHVKGGFCEPHLM